MQRARGDLDEAQALLDAVEADPRARLAQDQLHTQMLRAQLALRQLAERQAGKGLEAPEAARLQRLRATVATALGRMPAGEVQVSLLVGKRC